MTVLLERSEHLSMNQNLHNHPRVAGRTDRVAGGRAAAARHSRTGCASCTTSTRRAKRRSQDLEEAAEEAAQRAADGRGRRPGRAGEAQEVPAADQQGQHPAGVRRAAPGDRHRQGADHHLRGAGASPRSSATSKAQKDLAAVRESFRELEERYAAELARWEAEKPEVARQVDELEGPDRRSQAAAHRAASVAQFERILDRYPRRARWRPCGPSSGRGRSSASGTAPPATTASARRSWSRSATATPGPVRQSCKRILYFEEEPA